HGARGLQGRKPGRHKFSVIFGIGTKKFRTHVVKESNGNPDWNEESLIPVANASDHVFFTVTEKDDVLGQLIIPVASLLTVKGVVKKHALKAHKKCPNPQGELIFQCYVSKQKPSMIIPGMETNRTGQLTGFQRLRHSFAPTSNTLLKKEEKEDKKRSNSLATLNKKLSKSLHDIFHIGIFGDKNDQDENEQLPNKGKRFSLRFPSLSSGLDNTGKEVPVVTHIVPNMASIHGGTRLALEGRNLGLGKSDIMELMLCGSDLLDNIEFESESRIYVTTKPTTAGKGDLWIETISGGQNVIKNIFTFVDRAASFSSLVDKDTSEAGPYSSRRNSILIDTFTKNSPIPEDDSAITEDKVNELLKAQRTSSFNTEEKQRRRVSISGSATLPSVFSFGEPGSGDSSASGSPTGKYRKNLKHTRRASESVVIVNKEVEERKKSEKAELQAEILRLHKENQTLKQENVDMKTYIDGLVARVMIHCPEALAAGDDLKPLKSGTQPTL
ncbi:unnamed protein product, partial [Candidula unifasciata]